MSILGALLALGVATTHAAAGGPDPARWIVFSAIPHGTVAAQLFRIETTGTGLEQITTGKNAATDPAFSPDGKRVVFTRLGFGIFLVNVDGAGLRRLTKGTHDHFPVWSPDGKRIAFLRLYGKAWRLYVMNASGQKQRRLPLAPSGGRPSWTADSKSIFVPVQGALEKVDSRTGRVQKRIHAAVDIGTSQAATLSPNSQKVAFVAPRPSTPNCEETSCVVFALYMAAAPRWQTKKVVNDTGPAGWSPDGKTLVFAHRAALWLWPVVSGAPATITTGANTLAGDAPPTWQPR